MHQYETRTPLRHSHRLLGLVAPKKLRALEYTVDTLRQWAETTSNLVLWYCTWVGPLEMGFNAEDLHIARMDRLPAGRKHHHGKSTIIMDRDESLGHIDAVVSNENWGLRGSSSRVARYALANGALDEIDEDQFYSELCLGPNQTVRLVSVNEMVVIPSTKHDHRGVMAILALSSLEVMSGSRRHDEVLSYCVELGIVGLPSTDCRSRLYSMVLQRIRKEKKFGFHKLCARVEDLLETFPLGMDRNVLRVMQRLLKHGHAEAALDALFLSCHSLAPGESILVKHSERCAFVCGEALLVHQDTQWTTKHHPTQLFYRPQMSPSTILFRGWCQETVCYPGDGFVLQPIGTHNTMVVVIEGAGVINSSNQCSTGHYFLQSDNPFFISVPSGNRGCLKLIRVAI